MSRIVLSDRYELTEQIGIGSHSRVYLARDLNTNGLFACKKIDYGSVAVEIQPIIEREVQLTRQLEHPNVIKYYEILHDEASQMLYIIADYFKHGNLSAYCKARLEKGMKMDEDSVWMIIAQMADVLSFCHTPDKAYFPELGVVLHRNINPSSVYLKDDGTVVLGGFSMAEPLGRKAAAATRIGVANYMSPEMLSNRAYDEKADIWALGCMLYEICVGEPLFKGMDAPEVLRELRTNVGPYILPGYTEELGKIVSAMLEYAPDKRPSALQILQHPTVERMWQMYRGYLDVGVNVDVQNATENAGTLHFNCAPETQQQIAGSAPCPACNGTGSDCQQCGGTGIVPTVLNQLDVLMEVSRVETEADTKEMEDADAALVESTTKSKKSIKAAKKAAKSKVKKAGRNSDAEADDPNALGTEESEGRGSRGASRKKGSRTSSKTASRAASKNSNKAASRSARSRSNTAVGGCCGRRPKQTSEVLIDESCVLDAPSILRQETITAVKPAYEDVVTTQGATLNERNLLPGNRLATGHLHPTVNLQQFADDGSVPPPNSALTTQTNPRITIAGENYQHNIQSSFREGMVKGHGRDIGTPMTNTPTQNLSLQEQSMQYPQPTYDYQPTENDVRELSPAIQDVRLRIMQYGNTPPATLTPTLKAPTDRPILNSSFNAPGFQQSSYATPPLDSQPSHNSSLLQNSMYGSTPQQLFYPAASTAQQVFVQPPSQMQQQPQPVYQYQPVVLKPRCTHPVRYVHQPQSQPQMYQTPPFGSYYASPSGSVYGTELQVSSAHGLPMNASGRYRSKNM